MKYTHTIEDQKGTISVNYVNGKIVPLVGTSHEIHRALAGLLVY